VVRQQLTAADDGWTEATIPFESGEQAIREVLRMGADMEVLEPTELRSAVAAEAARISALHVRAAGTGRKRAARRPR
jgi:predicted DNA-binding transcriptional regulator YafY